MERPTVSRDGRYSDGSHERYICEGEGRTGHGPTAKSAYIWWWLAVNPWPKRRDGIPRKIMSMSEDAYGGVIGYEKSASGLRKVNI